MKPSVAKRDEELELEIDHDGNEIIQGVIQEPINVTTDNVVVIAEVDKDGKEISIEGN